MKKMKENTRLQAAVPDTGAVAPPGRKTYKRTKLDEDMYLQPEEIDALFACIESRRDRAMFRIAYHHGLRAHEVGLLHMANYSDSNGLLFIRRGQGSISREHRLVPEELSAIRAYLKFERGTMPGPLFRSRQGRLGISRFRLDQLMKEYCDAAGIRKEKANMQALKNSCDTDLAERGNAPDPMHGWLGQGTIFSSEHPYRHLEAHGATPGNMRPGRRKPVREPE